MIELAMPSLPADATGRAAIVLLDVTIKGTLLLLAAAAVNGLLLRRRSAAHRHAVWGAAMLGLLLLPVLSAAIPARPWGVLPFSVDPSPSLDRAALRADASTAPPPSSANDFQGIAAAPTSIRKPSSSDPTSAPEAKLQSTATGPEAGPIASAESSAGLSSEPSRPRAAGSPTVAAPLPTSPARGVNWPAVFCALWAAGAAGCLLLLLVDLLALRWLATRGAQITRGPWLETFDQLRGALGAPPVMLLEMPGAGMPLACGLVAPTLVLPGDAGAWPPDRRRVVLEHELAHVGRRDCATQLLARVACAVHWFNPLAWLAARQMRVERERACDDAVVRGGRAAPAEYAAHLLEIARSLRAARVGAVAGVAMARPSQLEGRLLAVLDDHQDHRPVGRPFVSAGIVTALAFVGALAAVRVAPREGGAAVDAAPSSSSLVAARDANGAGVVPAAAVYAAPQAPPATQPSTPGQPPASEKTPRARAFANGDQVEVKWGGLWRKAVVVNHRGDWTLIDYDGKRFFREWVEPWRIRTAGADYDIDGPAPINPYVRHNEGPPREQPGPAPVAAKNDAEAPAPDAPPGGADVPVTPVVRANVKSVLLDGLPPLVSLAPDAAPPVKAVEAPIALKGSTGQFFDHPEALLLSPVSGVAGVLHDNAPPGKGPPQFRLERVDLRAGQSLNVATLPLELEAFDLSPDGKLFLARPGVFGPGKGARLDVWQVDGDTAAHVVSFLPFTQRSGGEQVVWARFVDADHLLARSFDGELSCFAFRTATQAWSARGVPSAASAMSPGRKYVATSTAKSIAILDALSGAALGQLDLGDHPASSLAFKPDGRQLAAAGQDALAIWDLATANLATVSLPADVSAVGAAGQIVDWAAEGYLLLDHAHLVAPSKQAVVWTYRGVAPAMHGRLAAMLDGRLYYTADAAPPGAGKRPVIASVAMPDPAARGVLAVVGDVKMAVKPGGTVSLDVSVDGSIQQQVIDALTARLKSDGVSVAEGLPLKLIAKDAPGENRDVSYRMIGPGAFGRTEKISVQEIKHSIELTADDGKPLWKRGGVTAPPFFLSLKQGQTAQEAVAEQMNPSPRFFAGVRIPRFIPKTPGGFGASQLTATGAQPAKPNPPAAAGQGA